MDVVTPTVFTSKQLQQYKRFEKVRQSNRFNMFTPEARQAALLTRDEHVFILENFEALEKQYTTEFGAKP